MHCATSYLGKQNTLLLLLVLVQSLAHRPASARAPSLKSSRHATSSTSAGEQSVGAANSHATAITTPTTRRRAAGGDMVFGLGRAQRGRIVRHLQVEADTTG